MTRSLEGKVFHINSNNGVDVIFSDDVWNAIERRCEVLNAAQRHKPSPQEADEIRAKVDEGMFHHMVPIFTFVRYDRLQEEKLFTGSKRLFKELCDYIHRHGGRIDSSSSYVPFSNGPQHYDYRYVTTDRQFVDTFGVERSALLPDGTEQSETA